MPNPQKDSDIKLWQLGAWQSLAYADANLSQDCSDTHLATCYRGLSLMQLGDYKQGADLIKSVSVNLSKDELKKNLLSGVAYSLGRARSYLDSSVKNTDAGNAWLQLSADLVLGDLALPSLVKKRNSLIKTLPVEFKIPNDQWSQQFPEWSNHYVFNPVLGFWHLPAAQSIDYSDGDEIEERLLNALHRSADVSLFSNDLIQHQIDWPSRYHFSADRVNLLRPLATKLATSKVLELGCGCGAITRYLGELGAEVVALEGSLRRAEIAATRTRDLSNVTIVADRLQDIPLQGAFDVVTLIGVLEYSQLFVEAEDPIQAVLERAKSYLKPSGVLLVAIENQLGLKYFAGAPEDHGVGVMSGINDLYTDESAITFGHQELKERIQEAGFSQVETFLPFPDYKLPMLVVHPSGHKKKIPGWNLGTLLSNSVFGDKQKIPDPTFSLERAWPLVVRNGLTADLANSHLFVASLETPNFVDKQILASYFSPNRAGKYSQQIDFVVEEKKKIAIRRQTLLNTLDTLALETKASETYLPGSLHSDLLHCVIQRPNWSLKDILHWCLPWVEALRDHRAEPNEMSFDLFGTDCREWLPGHFIDAIPRNLILQSDGAWSFIDLEWVEEQPLPLALVVYRGLVVTLATLTSIAMPERGEFIEPNVVIDKLMGELELSLSEKDYACFMPVIERLSNQAQGQPQPDEMPTSPYKLSPFKVRRIGSSISNYTNITLYWSIYNKGFNEANTVKNNWLLSGEKVRISLELPDLEEVFTGLRIDFTNCPAYLVVGAMLLRNKVGEVLWQWDFSTSLLTKISQLKIYALDNDQMVFVSTGNDPQFILNLPENIYPKLAGAVLVIDIQGGVLHN